MIVHPQFDPVAIHLGPLAIHWYGLMYLLGFGLFLLLGNYRIRQDHAFLTSKLLDDLLMYGVLGVVIGGRLGEVLFYEPGYYFSHPAEIFMVWKGGMSFHGGFLGVLVGMALPSNYGPQYTAEFRAVYDRLAKRNQLSYVPLLLAGFATDISKFQPDGLHPVASVQATMMRTVKAKLPLK